METKDHWHLERTYNKRILKPIKGISPKNNTIIRQYIKDCEKGVNLAPQTKRGSRSHSRLLSLDTRMSFICRLLEEKGVKDITKTKDEHIITIFDDMRSGKIKRKDGKPFRSVDSYAKAFTSFWHWYQRIERKKGKATMDITIDLLKKGDKKPHWVYLSEKDFYLLLEHCKHNYKSLLLFLYDSGLRSPKESLNTRVSDLQWIEKDGIYQLNVRDEVSKTFGRKIKLMLCSKHLKRHIEGNKLKNDDYLFSANPLVLNRYLKRLAVRVFGNKTTQARGKYGEISLYDFRHNSVCYWLPRYKTESALKYRFGWKNSNMVHYYSEFLGMTDNIQKEDLLVDTSAVELERKLQHEQVERSLLQDQVVQMSKQMQLLQRQMARQVRKQKVLATAQKVKKGHSR